MDDAEYSENYSPMISSHPPSPLKDIMKPSTAPRKDSIDQIIVEQIDSPSLIIKDGVRVENGRNSKPLLNLKTVERIRASPGLNEIPTTIQNKPDQFDNLVNNNGPIDKVNNV